MTTLKRQKIIKKLKGFTLVEVLTVVFLGTVLILAAWSIYQASYNSYKNNNASSELTQNARIALERLAREIRQAQEIIVPLTMPPDSSPPIQSEITFQDGHTLFSIPSPDSDCKIQYINYKISNGELTRTITQYRDSGVCVKYNSQIIPTTKTPEIKAEKVSKLQFWGTNFLITIHLEVSDGKNTYQFETKVSPRN